MLFKFVELTANLSKTKMDCCHLKTTINLKFLEQFMRILIYKALLCFKCCNTLLFWHKYYDILAGNVPDSTMLPKTNKLTANLSKI